MDFRECLLEVIRNQNIEYHESEIKHSHKIDSKPCIFFFRANSYFLDEDKDLYKDFYAFLETWKILFVTQGCDKEIFSEKNKYLEQKLERDILNSIRTPSKENDFSILENFNRDIEIIPSLKGVENNFYKKEITIEIKTKGVYKNPYKEEIMIGVDI